MPLQDRFLLLNQDQDSPCLDMKQGTSEPAGLGKLTNAVSSTLPYLYSSIENLY